jgi:hypothetical protein
MFFMLLSPTPARNWIGTKQGVGCKRVLFTTAPCSSGAGARWSDVPTEDDWWRAKIQAVARPASGAGVRNWLSASTGFAASTADLATPTTTLMRGFPLLGLASPTILRSWFIFKDWFIYYKVSRNSRTYKPRFLRGGVQFTRGGGRADGRRGKKHRANYFQKTLAMVPQVYIFGLVDSGWLMVDG